MASAGADRAVHAAPSKLKNRKDFLAAARGARRHAAHFVLQIRPRGDAAAPPRFGLTVTKKTVPRAVGRNRIRRRFREALRAGAALTAAVGHDYVFVARASAIGAPFEQLKSDMSAALAAPLREKRPKNRPPAS